MPHRARLRVRFADIDHGGVMYFATILHYFHQALEDFFVDALGRSVAHMIDVERIGLPVVHVEVDYRRAFRLGDEMDVELRVVDVAAGTVTYEFTAFHNGSDRPSTRAWIQSACIDMDRFTGRLFPSDLREQLTARVEPRQRRIARG